MIHHWIVDDDMIKMTEPEEALRDFHRCITIDKCENCKAYSHIGISNVSYCDLLREHDSWLENKIMSAIEGNK